MIAEAPSPSAARRWLLPALCGYVAVQVLFAVCTPAANGTEFLPLAIAIVGHLCGALAIVLVAAALTPDRLTDALTLGRPAAGSARLVLAWVGVMLLGTVVINLVVQSGMRLYGIAPSANPFVDILLHGRSGEVALVAFGAICVAPLSEELFFRLTLFDLLAKKLPPMAAEALAAMLFALLHFIPENVPALFLVGLVLQYLQRRRCLWLSISAHALFNAAMIAMMLALRGSGIDLELP